jgi:hypothetical protein
MKDYEKELRNRRLTAEYAIKRGDRAMLKRLLWKHRLEEWRDRLRFNWLSIKFIWHTRVLYYLKTTTKERAEARRIAIERNKRLDGLMAELDKTKPNDTETLLEIQARIRDFHKQRLNKQ